MNTLLYDFNTCHVRRGDSTFSAGIKPEFSFEYEALEYDGIIGGYRANNADHELTPEQITEIETYIQSIEADATEQALMEAHMYLAETDWIISKIAEKQLLGEAINDLMLKYSAELQKREEARQVINGV